MKEAISLKAALAAKGQTVEHPDYAVRPASRIARIGILIAVVSILVGIASFAIALMPNFSISAKLEGIEQQIAALQSSISDMQ